MQKFKILAVITMFIGIAITISGLITANIAFFKNDSKNNKIGKILVIVGNALSVPAAAFVIFKKSLDIKNGKNAFERVAEELPEEDTK